MTPLVILIMTAAVVWFLRHFAYDRKTFVHRQIVFQLVCVSVVTVAVEMFYNVLATGTDADKTLAQMFNVAVAGGLWLITLANYYFFYVISNMTHENTTLLAMRQKDAMELEKFEANQLNYDELRMIRHEIKNHDFYMKELVEAGRYDELKEYLESNLAEHADWLRTYECGNYTVDVILNHEMTAARRFGVEIVPEVLIQKELPWPAEDICSLLSNLLDNAIEAARDSGAAEKKILFRMQPRQEYLFIRVSNPVSPDVPEGSKQHLHTTKADKEVHGFGTRVMRRIVKKYNGSIRFEVKDGQFITDVMLEVTQEMSQEEKA